MHSADRAIAIALGANRHDPRAAIGRALEALRRGGVRDLQVAAFYVTRPVDCAPGTPDFLNTAAIGRWRGSLLALLALCRRTETALGRPAYRDADGTRVLDIDVLLADGRQIDCTVLTVPHPRLTGRLFVLEPLAEIAPQWPVPPGMDSVSCWRDRRRRGPGAAGWGQRLEP